MPGDGIIEQGKEAIVGELVKEAKDSPNIREAGKQLARVAVTVTKAINVCLLPLAAVNFAYDKAREYFSSQFEVDLTEITKEVPPESIIEPRPSIVGPALQGLAFSHEEPPLKEMYLRLIASAMDARVSRGIHPAFVEIIRQLNADEAAILNKFLVSDGVHPIVEVRLKHPGVEIWSVIMPHLFNLVNLDNGTPVEMGTMSAMIDNFMRLGLLNVSYVMEAKHNNAYSWADERPEVKRFRSELETDGKTVECHHGTIGRTAFGVLFGKAVGAL